MDAMLNEKLEQGFLKLESSLWEEAVAIFEEILNSDSECAMAHLGKLLADVKVCKKEDLLMLDKPFDANNNFKRTVKYADEDLKNELEGYNNAIYERTMGEEFEEVYRKAVALMEAEFYSDASELFLQAKGYKNSVRLMVNCKKEIEASKKENVYLEACELLEYASDRSDIEQAVQLFVTVMSWKDSKAKIDLCGQKRAQLDALSDSEREELKRTNQALLFNKRNEKQQQEALKKQEIERQAALMAQAALNSATEEVVEENYEEPQPSFETAPVVEDYEEPIENVEVAEEVNEAYEENVGETKEEETVEAPTIENTMETVVAVDTSEMVEATEEISEEPDTYEYVQDNEYTYQQNEYEEAPKRSCALKLVIGLLVASILLIGILIVVVLGVIEINYQRGVGLYEEGNYTDARDTLSTFSFYRNSNELITECDYQEGKRLIDVGQFDEARAMFESLGAYKNSSDMITECEYQRALHYAHDGQFDLALEAFENLGYYKDSVSQLDTVRGLIYDKAVDLYRNDKFADAKYEFNKVLDFEDTEKYIRLIDFRDTYNTDASSIYDLIGFEDTTSIITENNSYLQAFMFDTWKGSGKTIRYYKEGSTNWCNHSNIASYSGSWEIKDGTQYHGGLKNWTFTIIDKNTIRVYCHKDGSSCTLYRQ